MSLYQLLFKHSARHLALLIGLGTVAGAANGLLFVAVNEYLAKLSNEAAGRLSFAVTAIGLLVVFLSFSRLFSASLVQFSQRKIAGLRQQLIEQILSSSYRQFTGIRYGNIYTVLTTDVANVAESIISITQIVLSVVTLVACCLYLLYLSPSLFLITLAVIALGMMGYWFLSLRLQEGLEAGRKLEDTFVAHVNHILLGFKEIKVNVLKGTEIYEGYVRPVTEKGKEVYSSSFRKLNDNQLLGQTLLLSYVICLLLFLSLGDYGSTLLVQYLLVLVYLLRPVEVVLSLIPHVLVANVSARSLLDLSDKLRADPRPVAMHRDPVPDNFRSLSLARVGFQYQENESHFSVGPIDLEIEAGKTIFIHGGNGSGKTTLIRLLTGLYPAGTGKFYLNGSPIDNYSETYKSLFSVVYSDFHLFDRLYGVKPIDEELARRYLALFELDHKVRLEAGRFTDLDLSTGQRKRLALIAALLENRPMLVLDEWAADQDPYFRKKFYEQVLPLIKDRGITTIAITHDDRYYAQADVLLKMDYGRLSVQSVVLPDNHASVHHLS